MFQIERQNTLLRYINEVKNADTDSLAEKFSVSPVTIRRDLDALSKKGLLLKTHGGAVSLQGISLYNTPADIPYEERTQVNSAAKQALGAAAAEMVKAGEIIILDSGSTTLEMAKRIAVRDLTVLTNDLKIALELASKPGIQVLVCGGALNPAVFTLTGKTSIDYFACIHVNKTFLGCDALDPVYGVSDRTWEAAELKKAMIGAAESVIMLADSSKLGKRVFVHVCDAAAADMLITDKIDSESRRAFAERNVEVKECL